MKRFVASLALGGLFACTPPVKPPPDAGVDTSCGLDCVAQQRYGLIVKRCFEYSSTTSPVDPADLGAIVNDVLTLEGGVQVLPVEYRQGGQIRMTDHFIIRNGALLLARRTFLPGQSVNYRDTSGNIVGVTWLEPNSGVGNNVTTSAEATVVGSGANRTETTSYRVTMLAPTTLEQTVPNGTYDKSVKLLFNESPEHGSDARRLWVKELGFTILSTTFNPVGGASQEFRLQKVRDIGSPDGGSEECGLGHP